MNRAATNPWPFSGYIPAEKPRLKSAWTLRRAEDEAYKGGAKGNEHFGDWLVKHKLDDRSSGQVRILQEAWGKGLVDTEARRRSPGGRGGGDRGGYKAPSARERAQILKDTVREYKEARGDTDFSMLNPHSLGTGHWEEFDSVKAAKQYARLMEGQGKRAMVWRNKVRVEDEGENPSIPTLLQEYGWKKSSAMKHSGRTLYINAQKTNQHILITPNGFIHRIGDKSVGHGDLGELRNYLTGMNPTRSAQQYRLAQAVLSGEARGAHMPVKVAREIVEKTPAGVRSEWSRNPKEPSEMTAGEINKALDKIDAESSKLTRQFIDAGRGHERPSEYLRMSDPLAMKAQELHKKRTALAIERDMRYGPGAPSRLPKGFGPRKRNPEDSAASMYESFHGSPSEQVVTYEDEEHYHEYLSELGVCCGFLVECVDGGVQAIGLSGYEWQGKGKDQGFVEGAATRTNPKRKKGPIGQSAELLGGWAGEADSELGRLVSGNPMSNEESRSMPNVAQIRAQATRIIKGKIPASVRKELNNGVRLGLLGHLKKDGLKPEVYYHPDHRHGAIERQRVEAEYSASLIANVVGFNRDMRENRSNPGSPDPVSPDTTLLCSNEDGTQLYLQGGDQSLDLGALGITGESATKELIVVGEAVKIYYETAKDFDNHEVIQYHHELGEETGEVPILTYDRLNERLMLIGGAYHIEKPMLETSPGIEN
jgi:hypothetical protein